ncbi:DUF4202 domain-containing protein [Flavilitoribacter nigricans]|uniref:DUF4202 domain-containing protein n=1 Tax=Flavilitoribacter nigricans (strain ATCC 23147 / DSM 23189 / NBRC 102662 / NCIMB 1420 / SS-2) TaxID=1122177 RepID=A0A2D0N131_FLAN2|nr:DUF4202 domain-containing protein [Flavilitoribacter nigricans]PHN01423.1 hypothetical protein CRP01_37185 [Flavilitoribacter nigricans DSM 23189 = NBRC 102662]
MIETDKFKAAIHQFDLANSQDPNQEEWKGNTYPKEMLYAERMTDCLEAFAPDAPEALQLAARCQHIKRWEIPRETYPMDRPGYHAWRNELKKYHAEQAENILQQVGYDEETIERVKFLLQKKQLRRDPDTQTLEDVICLVFLQYYFEPFSQKYEEEKLIDIVQKTWRKMSEKGHEAALKLDYSPESLDLIKKALA